MDDLADYLRESLVSTGHLLPGDHCELTDVGGEWVVTTVNATLDHAGRASVVYTLTMRDNEDVMIPATPDNVRRVETADAPHVVTVHECDEAALEGEDDGGLIVVPGDAVTGNVNVPQF